MVLKINRLGIVFVLMISLVSCDLIGRTESNKLPAYVINEISISLELLKAVHLNVSCEEKLSERIRENIALRMVMLKNLSPEISSLSLPEIKTLNYVIENQEMFFSDSYQSYLNSIKSEIKEHSNVSGSEKAKLMIKDKYKPSN